MLSGDSSMMLCRSSTRRSVRSARRSLGFWKLMTLGTASPASQRWARSSASARCWSVGAVRRRSCYCRLYLYKDSRHHLWARIVTDGQPTVYHSPITSRTDPRARFPGRRSRADRPSARRARSRSARTLRAPAFFPIRRLCCQHSRVSTTLPGAHETLRGGPFWVDI